MAVRGAGRLAAVRTLYRNGRLHTAAVREATALLVDGPSVAWIGDEDGAAGQSADRTVDLAGALVTPAFVDAHVHTTATGIALTGLHLAAAQSLPEALDWIEAAARRGRGRPIIGGGWDETRWPEQRPPTVAELDRAAYGGAVYLARVDAHSAVASSALRAAVPGLAALGGYSPGPLTGAAHDAVRAAALGGLRAGQVREAQRAALRHAAALGIACVHEMAGPVISGPADLAGLLELAAAEPLPEVVGYWGELHGITTARELGAVGAGGDLFCDGSLGSHTAALHEPYADMAGERGSLRYETAELVEHILACAEAGLQAGFHAIGDAAVDQVLDAFEDCGSRWGRPGGTGHRIEHAEYVRDPARLGRSGLIGSVQPGFDAAWGGPHAMYASRLGHDRAALLNPFAAMAAAGVSLAFGSDSPVTPLGPWEAIRAAVFPNDPAHALSPEAALLAHTRAGWLAAGRPEEGVLAPGQPATFAAWTVGEPGRSAPDERAAGRDADHGLPDLSPHADLPQCRLTVRAGVVIFDAASSTPAEW